MAFNLGDILVTFKANTDSLKRGLEDVKSLANKVKDTGNNITDSLKAAEDGSKKFAMGVGLAGAAVTAFGVLSVKSFSDSEDKIAQTNAVLKSTGGIAGVTADAVTKLATALEAQTKFSDEDVRSVENLLLTFTAIGKDIFPQATSTVLDMAQALGEDTSSASIQLGKALQDPILGVTALRRVGVNFNQSQQDVIKNLVDTGQSAKAQKLILAELAKEFGGSAKAAGDTFAGKLAKLKNQIDNVQEGIGELIVNVAGPLVDGFLKWFYAAGGVDGIMQKLGNTFNKVAPYFPVIIGAIAGGLVQAFVALGGSIWRSMAPLLPFIAAGAALALVAEKLVQHMGGWGKVMADMQPIILQAKYGVAALFAAFNGEGITSGGFVGAMEHIGVALGKLRDAALVLWTAISTKLAPALERLWTAIGPTVMAGLKLLVTILGVELYLAVMLSIKALTFLVDALAWIINAGFAVKDALVGAWNAVTAAIGAVGKAFDDTVSAISDGWSRFTGWVGNVWDATIKAIGDALHQFVTHFWEDIGFAIGFILSLPIKVLAAIIYMAVTAMMVVGQWLGNMGVALFSWGANAISYLMNINWGDVFSRIYNAIKGWLDASWNAVVGTFNAIINWVTHINWVGVFSAIGNALNAVWEGAKNAALGAWRFITAINWGAIAVGIGKGIANAIIDLIQGALNGALSGIPGRPQVHLPHFAAGVQNFRGGLAVVGENGPETVYLPPGANVYPNGQSPTGGDVFNITINKDADTDYFFSKFGRNQVLNKRGLASAPGTVGA